MARTNKINLKKIIALSVIGYMAIVVLFYYLAGEQLHFRDSRGNIEMKPAESSTLELTQDNVVEQLFTAQIQRLEEISVQWGNYYRQNSGMATIELYNNMTGELLLSKSFDVSSIKEGDIISLYAESPIEGIYNVPLMIRISSDSQAGCAATPMMSLQNSSDENFKLLVNGEEIEGELCFSAKGEDYIWTGLHYWELATGFGVILFIYFGLVYYRWRSGKRTLIVNAFTAMRKYKFLIKQLVDRDFKAKYKRSILGVFWSFLNPLLNMLVQYLVFSNLFRFDIPYYPVYLLCGNIIFNYFSESCGLALTSITGNASLITKVYVPKYIYPLTRILSSLINMVISMLPLFVVAVVSNLLPTKAYFLLPYPLICLALFCLGMGLLLSTAMVFFRDIQFLWGVITTVWLYLTPIFYPLSSLPESVQAIVKMNPMYLYITFVRACVMDGVSPEPMMYVQCFLASIIMLAIGAAVFKKNQDRFVFYL